MTPGKKRQAGYRARMLKQGKRQYSFWLTDEQAEAIKAYLAGKQSLLTEQGEPSPAAPAAQALPKPKLVPVQPNKPERLTEYEVWLDGKQAGRIWQVAEKPKWRGYPSGFNERQYSGPTRQAVIERVVRYQQV